MATVLGLAMRVTADASGLAKSLTPVDRALQSLGQQADKSAALFDSFRGSTAAAATAQDSVRRQFEELTNSLRDGGINAEQFAQRFAEIQSAAKETADSFARGLQITEQSRTAEELRSEKLAELNRLLELGAISQQTFDRAAAEASGANAEAAEAERARAEAIADANRIIQANLTPQERYDQQIQNLQQHLDEGRLTQEQFNRAATKARGDLDRTADSAGKTDSTIAKLNRNLSILTTIEVGRALIDGFRLLSNTFNNISSQVRSLVSNVSSSLDQLNDLAARTGVGTEALQGYSVAAKLAGVDSETLASSLQKLSVNVGKATPGSEFDKALRGIGLSARELQQLAPEQQFSAIGDAISRLPTVAERAAAAVQVFGKQGAALAPLFREGADSIEELRERAKRLGIIVSDQQVSNVADMNDGFDLVKSTIEGIIGQVIGNLAPAVTAVTEEFLKFVEEWSGTQGQGGTGIANAITDVLLDGAEFFAAIFDEFVGSFTGFSTQLENAGEAFNVVSAGLEVISGIFKAIVNTFEIVGNGIALALGKALEAIGSYVSTDLETFGRDLQTSATESLQQNLSELENAGQQITDGVTQAVFGNPAAQEEAGAGAAVTLIRGMRDRIRQERAPQFQIETNIDETRQRFDDLYDGIIDQSSAVTGAMREFETVVASVVDPLNMTEEEIKRIEEAQRKVNVAIDQEIGARQQAQEEAAKLAAEDQKRIESLLQTNDQAERLEQDILAVSREQLRIQEEINAARSEGDIQAANEAAARLAELDQLQARLEDQQQAIEQGFGQGFQAAFDAVTEDVNGLINKAAEFGNEGALAAQRLQEGIAAAQEQARAGILNAEAFNAEVQRQQQLFEQEIGRIEQIEQFRQQMREQAIEAEQQRQEEIAGAQQKAEQEREQVRQSIIQAEQARLEEQRKAQEAEARRQAERIRQLNTLGSRVVQAGDVRTAEGAALVLKLAAEAQDPALIEQRRQTKLLQIMSAAMARAAANYFDSPVEIVGYARIGGIP
jgi:hypothetical protein